MCPPYIADLDRLAAMISCVRRIRVRDAASDLPHIGPLDRKENIVGSSSAGCMSRLDQSMLSLQAAAECRFSDDQAAGPSHPVRSASLTDGLSPIRPPGRDIPDMNDPAQKRPGRQHNGFGRNF
jgi:hypothetical protein